MMARFCAYVEKVFSFGTYLDALRDARPRPTIPAKAVFASAFVMCATARGSLNSLERDFSVPKRLRGLVGDCQPSCDTIGRVYAGLESDGLRVMLAGIAHQLKRNKALANGGDWYFAAVDGHEFFRQSPSVLSRLPDPNAGD
jgi:hypothetical protein